MNGAPGGIAFRARIPNDVSVARRAAFRTAAFDSASGVEQIRVIVSADGESVAQQTFEVSAGSGELSKIPAGAYDVTVEGLAGGTALIRDTKAGVVVDAGQVADAGEFTLAPIMPAALVLDASPLPVTTQAALDLRGAKQMFTGIAVGDRTVVAPDDAKTFSVRVTLTEGDNVIVLRAVNPAGALGEALTLRVTLDKTGSLSTDTIPPSNPAVAILGAPSAVSAAAVTLVLSAVGSPADMQLSESAAFGGASWEPYAAQRVFSLSAGDGLKQIYARFRDAAGNVSLVASASVILDLTAPTAPGRPAAIPNPTFGVFTVSWAAAADAAAGVQTYEIEESLDGIAYAAKLATAVTAAAVTAPPGTYFYRVRAVDYAGNRSAYSTASAPVTVNAVPTIASLSVTAAVAGGTVNISGSGFGATQGATLLRVGGMAFTPDAWSASLITFSIPAAITAGTQSVQVVMPGASSNTATFALVPTVAAPVPVVGVGGTLVTLAGTSFGVSQGGAVIVLGPRAVTAAAWTPSGTQFWVHADLAANTYALAVTVGGQTSAPVTMTVKPRLDALAPLTAVQGSVVTGHGAGFGYPLGAIAVSIEGVSAAVFGTPTATGLPILVPAGAPANTALVTVTVNGLTSNAVTFTTLPQIVLLTPAVVTTSSAQISVAGDHFGAIQGGGQVLLDGVPATIVTWSDTSITANLPSVAQGGYRTLSVLRTDGYQSPARLIGVRPRLAYVSPGGGASPGDAATIIGDAFAASATAAGVYFNGVSAQVSVWTNTSISAVIPDVAAGSCAVTVATGGLVSASYAYSLSPRITGVSPGLGSGGTVVAVSGAGFGAVQGGSTVTLGGASVPVTGWTTTKFYATVPASIAAGARSFQVSVNSAVSNAYTFNVVTALTGLTPPQAESGQAISLSGTNFGSVQGASTVSIGGVPVTPTSWSSTSIITLVPALSDGPRTVAVTVNGSTANSILTVANPVTAPSKVQADALAATSAKLVWEDQSVNETSFEVQRSDNGGAFLFLGTAAANVTAYTDSTVSANNRYGYRVRAVSAYRQSAYAAAVTVATYVAADVAIGMSHTCARLTDGNLVCTGKNAAGQLGTGDLVAHTDPVPVAFFAGNVSAVAAGGDTTCAVRTDGAAFCWGDNSAGQVGDNSTTNRPSPVQVAGLSGVKQIAVGPSHTCALTTSGVYCWGANASGQLGDASTIGKLVPTGVSGISGSVVQVTVGATHTCAATQFSGAYCWGDNFFGQLGDNSTVSKTSPVMVSGLSQALAIAAGQNFTCALRSDNTALCWGNGTTGALGTGNTLQKLTPTAVTGLSGVTKLSAGQDHACAKNGSGIFCWGTDIWGQLGNGSGTLKSAPAAVSGVTLAVTVKAGANGSCALLATGGLRCWGANSFNQLGTNAGVDRKALVPATGIPSGPQNLVFGKQSGCEVIAGAAKCWGTNYYGQVGDGSVGGARRFPVPVTGAQANVNGITVGQSHACLNTAFGSIQCWGVNINGQLGDGSTSTHPAPTGVIGYTSSGSMVRAGGNFTCAKDLSGGVKCWGANTNGQVGDGTTTQRLSPVAVTVPAMQRLAAGASHACGLTPGGAVWCWGSNSDGQIGNGTIGGNVLAPYEVTAAAGANNLVAGDKFTCVQYFSGNVKCWGDNSMGQLADGTTTDRGTPVDFNGGALDIASIFAGADFICVQRFTGALDCVGGNGSGQLGVASAPPFSTVPLTVLSYVTGASAGGYNACAWNGVAAACWGESDFNLTTDAQNSYEPQRARSFVP